MSTKPLKDLHPSEWLFNNCPAEELHVCFYWEYFRSSAEFCEFIERFRRAPKSSLSKIYEEGFERFRELEVDRVKAKVPGVLNGFTVSEAIFGRGLPIVVVAKAKPFPKTPWLDLPEALRKELCQTGTRFATDPTPEDFEGFTPWVGTTTILLRFECVMTVEEIIKLTTTHLRNLYQKEPHRFRPGAGRKGHKNKLQQLGAMRLLAHYKTLNEAFSGSRHQDENKQWQNLYGAKREFKKGALDAEKTLDSLINRNWKKPR